MRGMSRDMEEPPWLDYIFPWDVIVIAGALPGKNVKTMRNKSFSRPPPRLELKITKTNRNE
jgi:hypothetical protein